jgi:hypothetical protein
VEVGTGAASSLLTGLMGFWKLDEATLTRVDSSGNGNDFTPFNTPGNQSGKIGNALALVAASSQYLRQDFNSDFNIGANGSFTFACWFNPASLAALLTLFSICADTTAANSDLPVLIDVLTTGRARFTTVKADTSVAQVSSELGGVTAGAWHFLVCRLDAAADLMKVQVNSEVPTTTAKTGDVNTVAGQRLYLGIRRTNTGTTSSPFGGAIDACGWWNRSLLDGEVANLYNGGDGWEPD